MKEIDSASADILMGNDHPIVRIHPELANQPLSTARDWELVHRSISGDDEAFDELAEKHRVRVYRHVYYMVGNPQDAEDLTSNTFLKAYEAMPRFKITGAPFVSWLIRIAHNQGVSHLRSKREAYGLHDEIPEGSSRYDAHTQAEISEDMEKVGESLQQLREREQKAILMRFVQGMNYKEVAGELGTSVNNTRVIISRGLAKLRKNIGDLNTIDIAGENIA